MTFAKDYIFRSDQQTKAKELILLFSCTFTYPEFKQGHENVQVFFSITHFTKLCVLVCTVSRNTFRGKKRK